MTVSVRPATDEELATYLAAARDVFAAERERMGEDPATAARRAEEAYRLKFPEGHPLPGHVVLTVEEDGAAAGLLWLGPDGSGRGNQWWVWDILVDEAFRGRGVGRQAMLHAEREARARGASELGLNVFGHNHVATSLYRSLGYEVTAMQMRKRL